MSDAAPESMWSSLHAALVRRERWDEFERAYAPLVVEWAGQQASL